MDKELTAQELEAQADALLNAAELEEIGTPKKKSKSKKASEPIAEEKYPPLDEKIIESSPPPPCSRTAKSCATSSPRAKPRQSWNPAS